MDITGWRDYRVLYQFFNPADDGPHFGFTTVLAPDAATAERDLAESHAGRSSNFAIVQTVEANDFTTGYTYADVKAQRTREEALLEDRRVAAEKAFWEAEEARSEE